MLRSFFFSMRFGYYTQKNRVLFSCFVGGLFFLSHDKVIPRKGFQKGRIIMKTAVIAIGGNAIIMEGQKGTIEEQFENVSKSCDHIIDLLEEGYNVVLTHGNGPHVGNSLIKGEAGKDLVPAYPMDACGAETQGLLGYVIKQSLMNRMKERGLTKKIASLVTQVEVYGTDPAFQNPTKPVGPFFTKEEADVLMAEKGYVMKEDSSRGYRRVVASPKPQEIIEKEAVKALAGLGYLVIAAGGGGIPVIKDVEDLYSLALIRQSTPFQECRRT